jgi:hypothetical protein
MILVLNLFGFTGCVLAILIKSICGAIAFSTLQSRVLSV